MTDVVRMPALQMCRLNRKQLSNFLKPPQLHADTGKQGTGLPVKAELVFVWFCVCLRMCVFMLTCVWRLEVEFGYFPQSLCTLYSQAGFLT